MNIKQFTPQERQEAEAFLRECCPQALATIRTDEELYDAVAIESEKLVQIVVPICKETRARLAAQRSAFEPVF
ncbi:MAG: hypothetical protein ACRC46_06255 [Thermoguttaceae bacterium]